MFKKLVMLAAFFYVAYQGAMLVKDLMEPYEFDADDVYHTFR